MKSLIILTSILFASSAFADQCAFISKESAKKAANHIISSTLITGNVLTLCQNCGETNPKKLKVTQVSVSNTGYPEAPKTILVNGKTIDLAYTYVYNNGRWTNLASVSDCEVQGESQFIFTKTSKKGKVQYILGPIL